VALLDDGPFLASMFALVDEALQQRGTARGAVRESIVVYCVRFFDESFLYPVLLIAMILDIYNRPVLKMAFLEMHMHFGTTVWSQLRSR
jgi:hypothetical protein